MKAFIREYLHENLQQADKLYFKPGKLKPEFRQEIIGITHGDEYTRLISDICYYYVKTLKNAINYGTIKKLREFYDELKSYNKNVFPIKGFSIDKPLSPHEVGTFIATLEDRKKLMINIKKLPSVAIRNLKAEIRQERDYSEMRDYTNDLGYFLGLYSMLGNRDDKLKKSIENKMFTAGSTLESLLRFAEEKENLLGGAKFTKNKVKKIAKENEYDEVDVIYEKGDIMVLDVTGVYGIKEIGCNSLWCFTYGSGFDMAYRNWDSYSTNSHVYIIIDFRQSPDSPDFMYVLIKPLKTYEARGDEDDDEDYTPLYNMANEEDYNSIGTVKHLIGLDVAKKLFTFGHEPEELEEPEEREPKDPNQLSFAFESKNHLKSILREKLLK
jgi:hypothetical protein